MAQRPGELVGDELPAAAGLGHQGPDQGYALTLAQRFEERLVLGTGEKAADVLAGCAAVAMRRASLFGRAPVVHDVRLALELFGWLDEAEPELAQWRRDRFAGAAGHHGYSVRRLLVESVPEPTLRSIPDTVASARQQDWRPQLAVQETVRS